MPLPVFSCELHARITLATDLQQMHESALRHTDAKRLADDYRLSQEVVSHIRAREFEWRQL